VCCVVAGHGAGIPHGDACTADSDLLAADPNTNRHSGTADRYPDANGDSDAHPPNAHAAAADGDAPAGDGHRLCGGL
jgi:hypothetical protein